MNSVLNNMQNVMKMATALRANPSQYLSQLGVPQNVMNDPKAVIQHLMNNGVVSQQQYDQARNMAKNFGINV